MNWIEELGPYLPRQVMAQKEAWNPALVEQATELHLHAGSPPMAFSCGRLWALGDGVTTREELDRLYASLLHYTPAVYRRERSQGYLTLPGGYRVGLAGEVALEDGLPCIQRVTSLCIRIRRSIPRCSLPLLQRIYPKGGALASCLVASAPGMGKTTLLRDAVTQLSCGFEGRPPLKVAVVDERGELAPSQGETHFAHILSGVEKVQGIPWLLRSLSPQLIIVDEIGSPEDARLLGEALRCGVSILASCHAGSQAELYSRESLRELLPAFPCKAILSGAPGRISYLEGSP